MFFIIWLLFVLCPFVKQTQLQSVPPSTTYEFWMRDTIAPQTHWTNITMLGAHNAGTAGMTVHSVMHREALSWGAYAIGQYVSKFLFLLQS